MAVHDLARIEEKLDRVAVGNTAVSETMGGLSFNTMSEVIEFAKLMSLSGNAVPKHLQGNPGMCLAVCVQAMEWRFSPFSVANKSYEVQNRLCFESQLVHAVIEQRAPIIGRLRHKFEGEDGQRRCIVTATLRETGETLEYISPPFDKILPKNSPLWKTKPDLQLYYNTSRDFCRAYFPDVLLGVYSQEELRDHVGPDNAKDVNDRPSVGQRLKSKGARGFSASHVERETRGVVDGHTSKEYPQEASGTAREAPSTGSETADANQNVGTQSAPPHDSNSSEHLQIPQSDAQADTPATALDPPSMVAGDHPSDAPSDDGDEQAGNVSGTGVPSNLPEGWGITYAAALRRAQKKESLEKFAKLYWEERGGWAAVRQTVDGTTASEIFNVFRDHFGNKDQIELLLRELI